MTRADGGVLHVTNGDAAVAPLVGRDPELELTELGEQVLTGTADFVTARWLGGVEIVPPEPAWRWTPRTAAP